MNISIAEQPILNGTLYIEQYNGVNRKLCLKIHSLPEPSSRLNKVQVRQLVKELQNWLGEAELPLRWDTVNTVIK